MVVDYSHKPAGREQFLACKPCADWNADLDRLNGPGKWHVRTVARYALVPLPKTVPEARTPSYYEIGF